MYFKSLFILICIFVFKLNTLIALTQDLSLTILVRSPVSMEYVLAKSVCKLLDRELRISLSFGGANTLDCFTRLDSGADEIIKKIEQNQFQYAIIKKSELANRPSNLAIRSILYFPADEDYVFITNQNVDPSVIKDINYGILNHLLEFRYLHDAFYDFDEESLIVKQDIPMHMGTLRFSDEWKSDKKRRFIEVD